MKDFFLFIAMVFVSSTKHSKPRPLFSSIASTITSGNGYAESPVGRSLDFLRRAAIVPRMDEIPFNIAP